MKTEIMNHKKRFSKWNIACISAILCLNLTACQQAPKYAPTEDSEDFYYVTETSKEDIVVNVAVMGESTDLKQAADAFNAADNGYCIKFIKYSQKDYGETNSGEIKLADFELVQDIVQTDNIDIITSNCFMNEDNYRNLQKKGAFVDLYTFMNEDPEINENTLNSHVLGAVAMDGKLYELPTLYGVTTMGGDPAYVGDQINWTFDEMISHWNEMPDNATIAGQRTKEGAYYTLIRPNLVSFIDYENGKAYFDSPEFKRCLEFCNSFDYGEQQKTEYDDEAPEFVVTYTISSFMGCWPFALGSSSPKQSFVGFPSTDRRGSFLCSCGNCFSISSKSTPEKQKAAWEFIRTFVMEEKQLEIGLSSDEENSRHKSEIGFCINNAAFETIKNNVVNKVYAEATYEDKGKVYETQFPSKADCEKLTEYINSIDRWGVGLNDSIEMLITEEIMGYFAGDSTLETCINHIQNRTSLWLSEQF